MNIEFEKSFLKDIRKITDKKVRRKLERVILSCKSAQQLSDIPNVKKLTGYNNYYRLKLGDYRIGIEVNDVNTLRFLVFRHRKDIYKRFP